MRIPSGVKPNKFQVLYTLIKSVVWSSHWKQSCKGLLSVVVTDILTFRHHHQSQEAYPAELTPVFEAWIDNMKVVLQTLEEMPVYANPPSPLPPPPLQFSGTHSHSQYRRSTEKKVSCPRTKHNEYAGSQNQICGPRVQSALTIKPLPPQHENCFMSV